MQITEGENVNVVNVGLQKGNCKTVNKCGCQGTSETNVAVNLVVSHTAILYIGVILPDMRQCIGTVLHEGGVKFAINFVHHHVLLLHTK